MHRRLCLPFAAMLLCLVHAANAAPGRIDPSKQGEAVAASKTLREMGKDTHRSGQPPRHTDPKANELLRAVFDTSDVDAAGPLLFALNAPVTARLSAGLQVGLMYMFVGTGITDLSEVTNDAALRDRINANTVRYAAEMGMFNDFTLSMQAALLQMSSDFVDSMPNAQRLAPEVVQGIGNVRSGAFRSVAGVIQMLVLDGLNGEWRQARIERLNAVAPRLHTYLDDQQRTVLRDMAREAAGILMESETGSGLESFAKTVGGA